MGSAEHPYVNPRPLNRGFAGGNERGSKLDPIGAPPMRVEASRETIKVVALMPADPTFARQSQAHEMRFAPHGATGAEEEGLRLAK